jgi:septal ring factor EnvC (AmiA/AmiB activator)
MKIDLKLIIIVILSILSVFFFFKYINVNDNNLADENKRLMKEVKLIEKQRDSISLIRVELQKEFDKIENRVKEREKTISNLHSQLLKSQKELDEKKKELANVLAGLDSINIEIERIREFPPKREGESLINSLTKKLNQK